MSLRDSFVSLAEPNLTKDVICWEWKSMLSEL